MTTGSMSRKISTKWFQRKALKPSKVTSSQMVMIRRKFSSMRWLNLKISSYKIILIIFFPEWNFGIDEMRCGKLRRPNSKQIESNMLLKCIDWITRYFLQPHICCRDRRPSKDTPPSNWYNKITNESEGARFFNKHVFVSTVCRSDRTDPSVFTIRLNILEEIL